MKLLIIGTHNSEIHSAVSIASQHKIQIEMVNNCEDAIDFLREGKGTELVFIDVSFDIESLTQKLKDEHISITVVAYGINANSKDAVRAIKMGAKEFVPMPADPRIIAAILAATVSDNKCDIIGESTAINKVKNIADKVAKTDAHILITGESGTGKEVFARYIHNNSARKNKNFVSVNCAAIPENLLESELFGHEKGAFTGAVARRIGKFEESSNGTLLLDEISEMDFRLQAKLLRAIQEKQIDRVGGTSSIDVNLRIIATSNRNLKQEILNGNFREDLYFRLNVINIELPPLTKRSEDIIILAEHFITKYANEDERKILSQDAKEKILEYKWPGNIRELENVIHRGVILSESECITAEDLNIEKETPENNDNDVPHEKNMIFNTLGYCLGDLNKTANILGISIKILKEKLQEFSDKN